MSFAICFAPCVMCSRAFGFNPHRVPSVNLNGQREPVCAPCHKRANEIRKERGLEPWPEPHPDAYEPLPAEDL